MTRGLKLILPLLLLALAFHQGFGQVAKIDSLTSLLGKTKHDTCRIKILIELGELFESSDPNKAFLYYGHAQEIAEQNQEVDRRFQILLITSTRLIGIVHYNQNGFDKAMECFMKSLKLSEKIDFKPGIIASFNNIGMVHESLRNFDLSIEYYEKSVQLSKEIGDTFGVARGYNNIGITYANQDKIHLAISSYLKAAEAFEKLGKQYYLAATYNNIGTYYLGLIHSGEQPDSIVIFYNKAKLYFQKSLPIFREMEQHYDLSTCLVNLAQTHLQLHKLLHNSRPSLSDDLQKALDYGRESLELAQKIKSFGTIYFAAYTLRDIYRILNNYPLALEYADLVISNNDSLFYEEKDRTIAEIEAIYQTEKKEQQIARQELEASRQKILRNALTIGLILMLLFAFSLYIGYASKRRSNHLIKEQYSILEQANAEILAQRDELEAQRDMLVTQNLKIEEAHTHITDSLHYAQSIQAAILPSENILRGISPNYFVLMKPYQVVSGDFFYAVNIDEYRIFGVADCTGHGVPGAFMSILGLNALNDIIVRHRIVKPNQILGYLRDSVINALGQNDPEQSHKDGIDMALCSFNTKTRELQYSGARIPLWIVLNEDEGCPEMVGQFTKSKFQHNNYSLYEVKADFMPVGIAPRTMPFSQKTFSLQNCSVSLYLATDGFMDQFGGTESSKYGSVRLKHLILQNTHKSFAEQRAIVGNEFEQWMGFGNQVDDVTVLGILL